MAAFVSVVCPQYICSLLICIYVLGRALQLIQSFCSIALLHPFFFRHRITFVLILCYVLFRTQYPPHSATSHNNPNFSFVAWPFELLVYSFFTCCMVTSMLCRHACSHYLPVLIVIIYTCYYLHKLRVSRISRE